MKEKRMDCYPWAAPTEEQKRMFDALSYEDQLEMVRAAIIEGENSGISDKTVIEIMDDVKARLKGQNAINNQ